MSRRLASSLLHDTRGATAVFVAIASTALIGTMGVALDTGLYYVNNRNLQAVTEAAALSAAVMPASAQSRATAFLIKNGYAAANLTSVEVGYYCANVALAAAARFTTSASANCAGYTQSNAVRLRTTAQSSQFLTGMLGTVSPIPALKGAATAARIDEAGLEMTSGVLALDVGVVNALLSALAGRNLALTSLQLQSLVASNIDAGLMFDALAARVGETGTYSALTQRTVSMSDLLGASASGTTDATTAAALQLLASQVGSAVQVPLAGLFGLGVWKNMPVGGANQPQSLRAGINAYQLIAYALQTNNRTANASGLSVGLPGVASVVLAASASGPLERPRFSFGPAGETTVGTAALRLLLKVQLLNLGSLLGISGLAGIAADVPLLIEVGSGTASITAMSCSQEAATDARVGVTSTSGLLTAYLGTLPADAMTQPFRTITPSEIKNVTLVDLFVASISIRAAAGPIVGASGALDFRQSPGGSGVIGHPPASGTAARVGSTSQLTALLGGLSANLNPTVKLLGIPITLASTLNALLAPIVSILNAVGLDQLVSGLLNALGVQAGYSDTWVTGARCGVPVLV